jgi:hypothetical protein
MLATEAADHIAGVASIASLMDQLTTAGLQDRVTFMTLNVFGRTLATGGGGSAAGGRSHNPNHQVSLTIGAPFKGGVIGGVTQVANDYGAMDINSATGAAANLGSGDIAAVDTLGAYAQTLISAVGGDPSVISTGKVIASALVP